MPYTHLRKGRFSQTGTAYHITTVTLHRAPHFADLGKGLWQANYYDHAVRQEEDLHKMARYMVANPLRANLVSHIGDYPLWDAVWLEGTLSG